MMTRHGAPLLLRANASERPDTTLLLVDTYDTLRSGVPNAITVFKELRAAGHEPVGIRLDSGVTLDGTSISHLVPTEVLERGVDFVRYAVTWQ